MPKQMGAILGPGPDNIFAIARYQWAVRKVAYVGVQVAPLRSKQVDQVQAFGLRLEHRGRRGQEMDMSIRSDPALRPQFDKAWNLERQLPLSRLDRDAAAYGFVFKALHHL